MLLWEADVREKNGKRQKAANIRGWVADLSKRAIEGRQIGLAQVAQTKPDHVHAIRTLNE